MANFRIGLGVCGGIAAYKAVEVLRGLQKAGCEVQVAMTKHATEFVGPLTFRALTEKHVLVDDYDPANPDPIAHINFSQNIDLFIVVPATANVIAKFAHGVADDFVTSTYLASTAPVLIAPAMNTTMWEHPATLRNIETLKADGIYFVEPDTGEMACKTVGPGRLSEPDVIVRRALEILQEKKTNIARNLQDLAAEKFLITVGGTREAIDPVRFISNNSSGKMGFALALAARERGAEVTVVAGVTTIAAAAEPEDIKIIRGISAGEMHEAVMRELPQATVFVGAAAVADYRPSQAAENKIKKTDEQMILTLEKTPDILSDVSKNRRGHHRSLLVIGFAAETNDVINYARAKLEKKNLDLVVANDVSKQGAGFDVDTNIITIVGRGGEQEFPMMTKLEAAHKVLDAIVKLRAKASHA
jgi:phosphopantothenoylcysteine decarboxylase/phosphopantothenate--cysteine ligase